VFHHQNGAPCGHFLDQLGHAVHVFMPHALRRFIEQHQFRFHRQRGGNFQRALAAIRQSTVMVSANSADRLSSNASHGHHCFSTRSLFQKWKLLPSCAANRCAFSSTVSAGKRQKSEMNG
jgi:hypothetical protein